MSITKYCLTRKIAVLASVLAAIQPLATQSASESDRLEKLERAVEQLQKRNAELEAEVRSLKKETAAVPDGKFKTKVTHDGKTYVEQAVPAPEKAPLLVLQRGPELKLIIGVRAIEFRRRRRVCLRRPIWSDCARRSISNPSSTH